MTRSRQLENPKQLQWWLEANSKQSETTRLLSKLVFQVSRVFCPSTIPNPDFIIMFIIRDWSFVHLGYSNPSYSSLDNWAIDLVKSACLRPFQKAGYRHVFSLMFEVCIRVVLEICPYGEWVPTLLSVYSSSTPTHIFIFNLKNPQCYIRNCNIAESIWMLIELLGNCDKL